MVDGNVEHPAANSRNSWIVWRRMFRWVFHFNYVEYAEVVAINLASVLSSLFPDPGARSGVSLPLRPSRAVCLFADWPVSLCRLPFQFLHWSRGRELNRLGRDKEAAEVRRSGSLRAGALSLAPARDYDSFLFI